MESSLVNARVPQAKKEVAAGILGTLGATTSELINGAYDYLIAYESLPGGDISEQVASDRDFSKFVAESTLEIDWGSQAGSGYKDILRAGKRADYESLT